MKNTEHFKSVIDNIVKNYNWSNKCVDYIAIFSGEGKICERRDGYYNFFSSCNFTYLIDCNVSNVLILISRNKNVKIIFEKISTVWENIDYSNIYLFSNVDNVEIIDNVSPLNYLANNLSLREIRTDSYENLKIKSFSKRLDNFQYDDDLNKLFSCLRCMKDEYEINCISEANKIAKVAHNAVKDLFFENEYISEVDLYAKYLSVAKCREGDMHYPPIVGLDKNSACLHYCQLKGEKIKAETFLIDAGVSFNGYTSDITRTYSKQEYFSTLIEKVDLTKDYIASCVKVGTTFVEMQNMLEYEIANLLVDEKIAIGITSEELIEKEISNLFSLHRFGHLLGICVHDVGNSYYLNNKGEISRELSKKAIVPGVAITIEPGLYFNEISMNKIKNSVYKDNFNWTLLNKLIKLGGIRMEDNYYMNSNGKLINLTKE